MTRGARERAYRRADAQGHTHAPEAYGRATGPQGRHRRGGRGRYSRRVFAPSRPKGEITPKNLFTARTSPGQIGFPKPNADAPKGRDHAFLSRDFFDTMPLIFLWVEMRAQRATSPFGQTYAAPTVTVP